jgi:hypothetical protein
MELKRNGSQPSMKGSSDNFTGNVRIDPLFQAPGACPPGKKHWHGASDTTAMTHLAIQESLNGTNVEWLEKVSDEQYRS